MGELSCRDVVHTHMLYTLEMDLSLRQLSGESYTSITNRGGGIHHRSRTRKASLPELECTSISSSCDDHGGYQTVEIKSGYGLDTETEIKMLRAIHNVSRDMPIKIVSTFLGAHAVRFLIEISLNYYSPSTFTHKIFHTTGTPRSRT